MALDPLQYIQTMQGAQGNPLQGNNLPQVIKALSQQKNNVVPQPNANNSNAGDDDPLSKPTNTYGGYNYGGGMFNQYAPGSGLNGTDMAQAAQAGVQSGLTFDPSSGSVY